MGIVVSAVGPLSNLFIAFVGLFFFYLFIQFNWFDHMSLGAASAFITFFNILISLNLLLFVFNLIPLPPLDGYRIIEDVATPRIKLKMSELERWSIVIFLVMVFVPPIRAVTLDPILGLTGPLFNLINGILSAIFGFNAAP
jgi:Zn-dependent protease